MKQITINLYSIGELSKEAQEYACEKYRHFNVDNSHWYDCEFDDFVNLCETIGINIPVNGISFSGFWSQGDGSTFASTINVTEFINGIVKQSWREYAPNLDFDFDPCPCDKRVIGLIEKEAINFIMFTDKPHKGYWITYYSEYDWTDQTGKERKRIGEELRKLDKWAKKCLETLNRHLYKSLQEEYEYQTSDETLRETFEANEYLFTADGKKANRLLGLAVDIKQVGL